MRRTVKILALLSVPLLAAAGLQAGEVELPRPDPEQLTRVKRYLAMLRSEDADDRAHAWKKLRESGTAVRTSLAHQLLSGTDDARAAAAEVLGELRDAEAAPFLERALEDKSEIVRANAARALGEAGAKKSSDRLAELMEKDPSELVQGRAAWALVTFQDARASAWFEARLASKKEADRLRAAKAISRMGDARFIPHLARLLDDPNEAIRLYAVTGLGRLRAHAVEALVTAACHETDDRVAIEAAKHLNQLVREDLSAIGALVEGLGKGEVESRLNYARALKNMDGRRRRRAMKWYGTSFDTLPAEARLTVLARMSEEGEDGLELLVRAIEDKDEKVREAAVMYLQIFSDQDFTHPGTWKTWYENHKAARAENAKKSETETRGG